MSKLTLLLQTEHESLRRPPPFQVQRSVDHDPDGVVQDIPAILWR